MITVLFVDLVGFTARAEQLDPEDVRALLLPTPGLTGDLDQFVVWVHGIATAPLGQAYDQDIAFPPVMVYLWAFLATLEPAFRTVTDSADPAIRALMKLPASAADLALAAGIGWALRARPTWAVVAALGVALHPAVIDISAWWGQYEPLYVLPALAGFLLVTHGRPGWAAVRLAPQTDGLDWARGAISTPAGRIAVEWRREGERVEFKANTPTGVPVELHLPGEGIKVFPKGGAISSRPEERPVARSAARVG